MASVGKVPEYPRVFTRGIEDFPVTGAMDPEAATDFSQSAWFESGSESRLAMLRVSSS